LEGWEAALFIADESSDQEALVVQEVDLVLVLGGHQLRPLAFFGLHRSRIFKVNGLDPVPLGLLNDPFWKVEKPIFVFT
jgi:hypothetical protein